MPLPPIDNARGDLPPGVHAATLAEVVERFGSGTPRRREITARLIRIHAAASATEKRARLIIFGSYITAKPAPGDIDIVLIMDDDFQVTDYDAEIRGLFDHEAAEAAFGASIFWTRPSFLILETVEEFVAYWQIKRDGTLRGIVEVIP